MGTIQLAMAALVTLAMLTILAILGGRRQDHDDERRTTTHTHSLSLSSLGLPFHSGAGAIKVVKVVNMAKAVKVTNTKAQGSQSMSASHQGLTCWAWCRGHATT